MLDSATTRPTRTDSCKTWWSAGLRPQELSYALTQSAPAWAEYVERSTSLPPSAPVAGRDPAGTGVNGGRTSGGATVAAGGSGTDWRQALMRCLEPLLDSARQDLAAAGHRGVLAEAFLQRLGLRLVKLAARTLVLELARARDRGELAGDTSAARFLDFTRRLVGGSELAEFLATYPVLARVLGESCRQGVEGHLELLARLAEDRASLVTGLLDGRDPGALTAIEPAGDAHQGGRCTAILTFENGQRLVYKPRPLALHRHFNTFVDWLNARTALGIRTVRLLPRDGYGWLEFVVHEPCADLAGVRRFYHRQGALLALLYVLDGTDMHFQNLIAAGDQPVLVDVETLFHPTHVPATPATHDPAYRALLESVYRTALLPLLVPGENGVADVSGLGGDDGATAWRSVVDWEDAGLDSMHLVRRPDRTARAANRPLLDGAVVEPQEHETAVLTGFRTAYEAIARHRDEFLRPDGLLAQCAVDQLRFVPRATTLYTSLLDESTHPDVLRDAAGRSQLLDLLWDADESLYAFVPYELADLWAGDVPLFTARPDSRDIWSSDGTRIADVLAVDGLAAVRAKVANLGDIDEHRQAWLISASLATRPEPITHAGTAVRPHVGTSEADPEQILAAAADIADEIVAQVVSEPGGAANWLGLELLDDDHWSVRQMGAGLPNGYTGTALFLAQIGVLTGAQMYCDLARDAIRPIPRLLEALAEDPESANLVGPGFHGLGGISYGLHRLSGLLADTDLTTWLESSLELSERLVPDLTDFPSYAEGAAGGLAAMQAVQGFPAAGRLAERYADHLVATVESGLHGRVAADHGFARGYQGIAWALGQYGVPGDRYVDAARVATDLDRRNGPAGHGWCRGDAGTTLARASAGVPADLDAYLRAATERPVLADLSLCHGELGAVESLLWLAEREYPATEAARRRRAGLVLAAVQQYGPQCGTPSNVPSPGLLTGLAGIGYGLLRLAFPERVPSVLLLQPTAGSRSGTAPGPTV
ncbi:type 2 lanthipeptide synthetase LanM family protein [Kribbella sp.]|uniref:type 2 lanthipeptide synthetase LanM family protein n=1 Tax=Kribbella sp. TaxID=1871183 RepID=UPI002D6DE9D5|nr:type 2 lanthipeptide synthetase LanM family protein [Kribbella sp.]HZX02072.1 type 2 lanthipeptide synthetase LanM family protein [Kribbella sp.]